MEIGASGSGTRFRKITTGSSLLHRELFRISRLLRNLDKLTLYIAPAEEIHDIFSSGAEDRKYWLWVGRDGIYWEVGLGIYLVGLACMRVMNKEKKKKKKKGILKETRSDSQRNFLGFCVFLSRRFNAACTLLTNYLICKRSDEVSLAVLYAD